MESSNQIFCCKKNIFTYVERALGKEYSRTTSPRNADFRKRIIKIGKEIPWKNPFRTSWFCVQMPNTEIVDWYKSGPSIKCSVEVESFQ
ncbi:hypothetical protein CEXT_575971 [Caerostris extrusa]|uniref:Uncharacterized protein n=1 Tax=Caerostris extrusa TaxID=172846 RepID=A0AAV4MSI4_CAEEX|nr:hypothetical protein CEXT_575971 [Caerostris extrusa]